MIAFNSFSFLPFSLLCVVHSTCICFHFSRWWFSMFSCESSCSRWRFTNSKNQILCVSNLLFDIWISNVRHRFSSPKMNVWTKKYLCLFYFSCIFFFAPIPFLNMFKFYVNKATDSNKRTSKFQWWIHFSPYFSYIFLQRPFYHSIKIAFHILYLIVVKLLVLFQYVFFSSIYFLFTVIFSSFLISLSDSRKYFIIHVASSLSTFSLFGIVATFGIVSLHSSLVLYIYVHIVIIIITFYKRQ